MWSTGPCDKKRTPLCKESFNTFVRIAKPLFTQLAILQSFVRNSNYTTSPSIEVLDALLTLMLTPAYIAASHTTSPLTPLSSASAESEMLNAQLKSAALDLSKDTATGTAKKATR